MVVFFSRFVGALMLDPSVYEDVEADRRAGMQSVLVVLAVTLAGGVAGLGLGVVGMAGFVIGAILALGGWLVWVSLITTLGTTALAEPQTRSNAHELLRTLAYAAAPGVFLAFAAIRPAAPLVFVLVSIWMIAAAVVAVRQALDYRSTVRAAAVCTLAWLLAVAAMVAFAMLSTRRVA